jgi:hypothetical protein
VCEQQKILWTYQGRIRGISGTYRGHIWAYRDVSGRTGTYQSCQNTPIRQLKYWMRIARESHPHPIRYISDTEYMGKMPNMGNIASHKKKNRTLINLYHTFM